MSQITRCPSCATQFKVVADQLRISEGWVRCGQCQHVFDARQSLQPAPAPEEPPHALATTADQAVQPSPGPVTPRAESVRGTIDPPTMVETVPSGYELPAAVSDDEDDTMAPAAPLAAATAAPSPSGTMERPDEGLPGADPWPEPAPWLDAAVEETPALVPPSVELAGAEENAAALALPEAEPAFVRAARRKAFWQRRDVRVALGLGSGALLLTLMAQVVLQERNALAAWQPSLRPALQGLCALAGCTLTAHQDINQIVIASSAFTRTALSVGYTFSLTVENQSDTELAMPAVELTLTDLQDRPVLRRVLLPAELQAPSTLAAKAAWSASIPLAVSAEQSRIAGYRALVFYP